MIDWIRSLFCRHVKFQGYETITVHEGDRVYYTTWDMERCEKCGKVFKTERLRYE